MGNFYFAGMAVIINILFIFWFHKKRIQVFKDIQLQKMLKMNDFSEYSKMATGLVHELANPLSIISLNLETITQENGKLDQDSLDKVVHGVERIKQLLNEGRAQLQKQDARKRFSAVHEIKEMISVLEHKAEKNNIHIYLNVGRNTKHVLHGNSIKFGQIIATLVSNAIDAYDGFETSGQKKIKVKVSSNKDFMQVKVRDWGSGIVLAGQKNIYQPLFSTKNPSLGTGIGLFLSKSILEKDFKGTIKYKTQRNKGTTFTISFPLVGSLSQGL